MVSLDDGNSRISRLNLRKVGIILAALFAVTALVGILWPKDSVPDLTHVCPQVEALIPKTRFRESTQFFNDKYVKHSADLLGGAVQIPSVSYDDMNVDPSQEPRFKVFKELHKYLLERFPLAAEFHETVNEYGLLFTVQGSDRSIPPALLMAHQDVVPVNPDTEDQWDHSPFSGKFDGEFLYGRGACDTKNTLVATLEAVESLLQQGWKPKRTTLLAFGYDEEIGGSRGAGAIAKLVEKRYGHHGVAIIIDEGTPILEQDGVLFAAASVAEKGRADFTLNLNVPGGHSSQPPPHTGIGILADLVTTLEGNPFTPVIQGDTALTEFYSCVGKYDKALSKHDRSVLTRLDKKSNREKLAEQLDADPLTRFLVRTSQAVDLFHGGVKINALPENVQLQVDHRIATHQSVEEISDRLIRYAKDLAKKYDLGLTYDHDHVLTGSYGTLNITRWGEIDPAPVSPYSGELWDVLAGTTKHIYENVFTVNGENQNKTVVFTPTVMYANTDTARFWGVSKAIYRYNPVLFSDLLNIHTVNEKLRFRSHLTSVAFFYDFLLNFTL